MGGSTIRLSASEEQAYLEKWEQLQKYIEPLKRMISRIDKDEGEGQFCFQPLDCFRFLDRK